MLSEKTFKSIFNNAVDGVLVVDMERLCIEMANSVFCRMTGYGEDGVKGLSFKDIHPETDILYAKAQFNAQVSGLLPIVKDMPFLKKDGSIFYADINSFEILDGQKKYFISILRDVSERKHIVDELSFKTTLLETQLETTIDGVLVVDDKGKTILFNNKFVELWDIPQHLLEAKKDEDMVQYVSSLLKHPDDFISKIEYLYKHKDETSIDEIEFKDGRIFERYSAPLIVPGRKYFGRIWYFRDISELKKTENALKKSEETFRLVTESTNDAIWDWNLKTNKVYRNSRYAEMLGYEAKEISDSPEEFQRRIHPDDKPILMQIIEDNLNGKRKSIELEFRLKHKSGKYIWVLARGKVVERDEQGNPVRLLGSNIDITSRKETEEELLRLNKAIEQSSEGIVLTDMEPRILYVNKAWIDMHGYAYEEALGMLVTDIQTEKHQETYENAMDHMVTHEKWAGETSHKKKDGTTFPIQISVSMLKNEDGEPIGFLSVSRDITELKKTRNALIESELKYRTLVENATVDIGSVDKDGRMLLINKKSASRFGGKPEDIIGKTLWDLFEKDFADAFIEIIHGVINTNSGKTYELSPELDGITSIHETTIEPLRMPGEPVSSVMIMSYEITGRKQAEEALKESEEKYRVLVESAKEAIVVINKDGEHLFMNTNAAQRVGGKPEDYIGKTLWDLFPKEEADKQVANIRRVIETNQGTTVVSETIIRDENYWFEITIQPLVTKAQTLALVISRNITERKKIENALRESEEQYRALVEGAGETIAVIRRDGTFQFMNTTAGQRLGGKPEDFIGKKIWEVFPKEIADRHLMNIRKVMDSGKGENFVSPTVTQGMTRWYETTIEPLRNNQDEVYAGLIIGRDITKLKNADEELEKYRDEIAHAERLASLGTLSATAAHELTQPLTVVRLQIENAVTKLQQASSPEVIIEKLRDSLVEISNITSVINRLRTFARKSTDKALKDVNLKTIANRIMNLLRESSRLSGVEIKIQNMDNLPKIYSNEKDIEQLFFALLDNAIQAAENKKDKHIIISGLHDEDYVELKISDNCGGIAKENIDRIFEPFFTTKPANKGTGLGLCIVNDIVSRAGGKIRVESELGEGTTFFVNLPLNMNMR